MAKKKEPKENELLEPIDQNLDTVGLETLYQKVKGVIERARTTVYQTANFETVKGYWEIGQYIVEDEQHGKNRASKGASLIKTLSEKLTLEYGEGFDSTTLKRMRKFYLTFPKGATLSPNLSWSHYRLIITLDSEKERLFYINESIQGRWGVRTLERSIHTKLYERTLMIKSNPNDVKDLVQDAKINANEQEYTPKEFIKQPYVLTFTGLKPNAKLYEKDLEQALIDKLQDFLIELGRGFAFVGRQYRFSTGNNDYRIDLVFYNYILKCFLLIDLKTEKLTYGDIGQMDFYVRYFEEEIRQKSDNPTIGLILCVNKDEDMVKYTLLKDSEQIFASEYRLYLPSEEQFKKEILEEKERLEFEQRLNQEEKTTDQ
jgi:predicted nuclease of restriction endonuclease-like (RecB) superfamily